MLRRQSALVQWALMVFFSFVLVFSVTAETGDEGAYRELGACQKCRFEQLLY